MGRFIRKIQDGGRFVQIKDPLLSMEFKAWPDGRVEVQFLDVVKPSWDRSDRCAHLGQATRERVDCVSCGKGRKLFLFECSIHGRCVPKRIAEVHQSCTTCKDYQKSKPTK